MSAADQGELFPVPAPPAPRHPRIVHCKQGARFDVYIGRPSVWGNPFEIGRDGTREQVIARYRAWVRTQPDLMARLPELRGKTLGCWCAPHACHGEILLELAERPEGRSAIS